MGIFSFSLVYRNKVSFSPYIYLLSLLLVEFDHGHSFLIQFQIKYLLKMENISTYHKGDLHVYASNNLCSQINNLVSNGTKLERLK